MSRGRCVAEQRRREFLVEPVEIGKAGEFSRVIYHGREISEMNGNFAVKRHRTVDAVLPELVDVASWPALIFGKKHLG